MTEELGIIQAVCGSNTVMFPPLVHLKYVPGSGNKAPLTTEVRPVKLYQLSVFKIHITIQAHYFLILAKKTQEQISESRSWKLPRIKFLPF